MIEPMVLEKDEVGDRERLGVNVVVSVDDTDDEWVWVDTYDVVGVVEIDSENEIVGVPLSMRDPRVPAVGVPVLEYVKEEEND